MQGCPGEEIVDDTVWVVKSHSPWCVQEAMPFYANKVIVIVRNPLDTNLSWLHLCSMNNHATKQPFECEKRYPEYFDWWIKDCNYYIAKWMTQICKDAKFREVPMLFVRFEDLVNNPEPELNNIMSFMLGMKDLTGTNAERRIKEVLAMDQTATQTYKLKDTTRQRNANGHRYTKQQLDWISDKNKEWLNFFGYTSLPHDPENETGFFAFDGSEAEMVRQY